MIAKSTFSNNSRTFKEEVIEVEIEQPEQTTEVEAEITEVEIEQPKEISDIEAEATIIQVKYCFYRALAVSLLSDFCRLLIPLQTVWTQIGTNRMSVLTWI